MTEMVNLPITDDWLREVGFKWHQIDRQPSKHWLLWLGSAFEGFMQDSEDLGIEISSGGIDSTWFCWLRSDTAGRYHRFIHIRHLRYQHEVSELVAALTGIPWKPENHIYGGVLTQKRADWHRAEDDRLDRRIREMNKWQEIEKDDSRGGALPEHLEAHAKAKPT